MSDATKAALDAAIAAHFAEALGGGFVTGYVIQIAGKTAEDLAEGSQTSYYREVPEGQPAHVSLGLIDYVHTIFRSNITGEANRSHGE